MKTKKSKGAAMLEYAMLIIIVVLVIFATQVYTKRAFMGYWRQMTDTFGFGRQYEEVADPPDPCAGDHCGDGTCNCGETTQTCLDDCPCPFECCSNEDCYLGGYSGLICYNNVCVECINSGQCPPGESCWGGSCGP